MKKYLTLSITSHLLLVIAIALQLSHKNGLEIISSPSIKSFAYTPPAIPESSTHSQADILTKKIPPKKSVANKIQNQNNLSDKNSEQALLKILHDAIAEKQTYPESAIALQQSGTVTVGFMLYPNGHIDEISLVKSSKVETLDAAALTAVHAISLISNANQYINHETHFAIDILYQ